MLIYTITLSSICIMTCTDVDLTETTCTASGCSAAAPLNSVLSSPISLSTVLVPCKMVYGGGGGGGGVGGVRTPPPPPQI